MEMITITKLEGQWPNQSIEFTSIDGSLKSIDGEILQQDELPSGELVEVHTEIDENDIVVNRVYVRY